MNRLILRFLVAISVVVLPLTEAGVCDPNPCKNGGSCQPPDQGYKWGYYCSCPPGFVGAHCQWDSYECTSDTKTPCVNGGRCVVLQDGRFCICPGTTDRTAAFGGHYCEIVNPCSSCPANKAYCQPAPYAHGGRLCLDDGYKVIKENL